MGRWQWAHADARMKSNAALPHQESPCRGSATRPFSQSPGPFAAPRCCPDGEGCSLPPRGGRPGTRAPFAHRPAPSHPAALQRRRGTSSPRKVIARCSPSASSSYRTLATHSLADRHRNRTEIASVSHLLQLCGLSHGRRADSGGLHITRDARPGEPPLQLPLLSLGADDRKTRARGRRTCESLGEDHERPHHSPLDRKQTSRRLDDDKDKECLFQLLLVSRLRHSTMPSKPKLQ